MTAARLRAKKGSKSPRPSRSHTDGERPRKETKAKNMIPSKLPARLIP
jgi:hypothetical protein